MANIDQDFDKGQAGEMMNNEKWKMDRGKKDEG
jgi:hypothetical protein